MRGDFRYAHPCSIPTIVAEDWGHHDTQDSLRRWD